MYVLLWMCCYYVSLQAPVYMCCMFLTSYSLMFMTQFNWCLL